MWVLSWGCGTSRLRQNTQLASIDKNKVTDLQQALRIEPRISKIGIGRILLLLLCNVHNLIYLLNHLYI